MRRAIRPCVTGLLLLVLLTGCGRSIATRALGFTVTPDANDHTPVPVELVVAYDPELVPALLELTARQWFESRQQLLRDYPRGLRAHLWELVPGQNLPSEALPLERRGAAAAFVYADFRAPGAHRIRVDPYDRVVLRLTRDSVQLEGPQSR